MQGNRMKVKKKIMKKSKRIESMEEKKISPNLNSSQKDFLEKIGTKKSFLKCKDFIV